MQELINEILTTRRKVLLWEANRSSASQEIPRILWNPEVLNHIHNRPPSLPIFSWRIQSMTLQTTSWRSILIFSSHLDLGLTSDSLHQLSPPKPCMYLTILLLVSHALYTWTQRYQVLTRSNSNIGNDKRENVSNISECKIPIRLLYTLVF